MIIVTHDSCGLAYQVAKQLNMPIIQMKAVQYADGELRLSLSDASCIEGQKVTLIQSTGFPVNETVLTLAFMIQQLKQAGATHVRVLIPYFGYARQDVSDIGGQAGHAAVIAQLLENVGADQILVVEAHSERLLSFFTIPTINISLISFLAQHIAHTFKNRETICLVAPDFGAHARVAAIARLLEVPMLTCTKERYAPDSTRILGHQGDCSGKEVIIIDDIIATGGTALHAAHKCVELGATAVHGYFVHPVLSADACERLQQTIFSKIFVTNSLPLNERVKDFKQDNKFFVIDISAQLADVLKS